MRWDALFDDLDGQLAAAEFATVESEVSERVRLEQSGIEFADRMRGQVQRHLRVRVEGGTVFGGEVTHVGSEWLVIRDGMRSILLPFQGLQSVEGLGRFSSIEDSVGRRRLGMASAFRALARDRAGVAIYLRGSEGSSSLVGTIDRVGRDFIEVALAPVGELRSAENISGIYAIPFSALLAIGSQYQ
ncbi:hypothetical protein [Arthrobacter roseus]|uniref:hypothetical protein n=1 Tax=Arthrobacter roseus TaxID=136274 RepID=UPI00196368AB|nr:hypothetical protein [Arthrobacter roseus]MBM7849106.1 hypothetical protein [Arthrobacter roseus]